LAEAQGLIKFTGLRENYISTSIQESAAIEDDYGTAMPGGFSTRRPAVVHFPRSAAVQSSLLEMGNEDAFEAREMAPFHANYPKLTAPDAHEHAERALSLIDDLLEDFTRDDEVFLIIKALGKTLRSTLVSSLIYQATQALIVSHYLLNFCLIGGGCLIGITGKPNRL